MKINMPRTSKEMDDALQFLEAYYTWLDNGAPDHAPFLRRAGLCTNSANFNDSAEVIVMMLNYEPYPFGRGEYMECRRTDTQHLDKNRIAWVLAATEQLRKALDLV